jgi:predicted CoA-binding protein
MVTGTVSPVEVLERCRTIAVVGASSDPEKDAQSIPRYLKEHGYRIIPVNPTVAEIMGDVAYPSLLDMPEGVGRTVDVVEVFRPSDELPRVALQAVEMKRRYGRPLVFWAQAGLESEEAKGILDRNGIQYVMDACMRVVHQVYVKKAV